MSGHQLFAGVMLTLAALAAVVLPLPTLAMLYTLKTAKGGRR